MTINNIIIAVAAVVVSLGVLAGLQSPVAIQVGTLQKAIVASYIADAKSDGYGSGFTNSTKYAPKADALSAHIR